MVKIYESGQLVVGNELGDESITEDQGHQVDIEASTTPRIDPKKAKQRKRKKIIAEKVRKPDTPIGFLIRLSNTYFQKSDKAPPRKQASSKNVSPISSRPKEVFVKKNKVYPSSSREDKGQSPGSAISIFKISLNMKNEQPASPEKEKGQKSHCSSARLRVEKVNESITINSQKIKENLNDTLGDFCVVCCEKHASSVFMPCGHGGICDDCAIDIFQKKNKCHLCQTVRPLIHFFNCVLWFLKSCDLFSMKI